MALVRVQKLIAQAGIASRRAAEQYIVGGRVSVNGKRVCALGVRADDRRDRVEVDGIGVLRREPLVYLAVHKPTHVMSTAHDPEGRQTVLDLVHSRRAMGRGAPEGELPRVYPVGRLDFDAEGLLLLTNDGTLTQALLHPRRHVPKTYRAKLSGIPDEGALARLRTGVRLRETDGSLSRRTGPAEVQVVKKNPHNCWLELTLFEGRNHQVKRMCSAIGQFCDRLVRTHFAGIELDAQLPPGTWRALGANELANLRAWL